jgi:hypothetical protein
VFNVIETRLYKQTNKQASKQINCSNNKLPIKYHFGLNFFIYLHNIYFTLNDVLGIKVSSLA